ncbi:MAG TPA: PPOX class F420-dependent oxidoreductase [Mycobacteriales bacterium]|nr:PPOX class F420-dependent oxidoreductase [Mycobacteriales bacterium]
MEPLLRLLSTENRGVLATLKRDGRPQMSTVNHTFDEVTRVLRVSITDVLAKTRNLRRDPRASFYVCSADGWSWTVAEGVADLSPVARALDDATVEELIEVYRLIQGEHPDWDDYRRAMVADQRLVLRLPVDRAYGDVR